MDQISPRILTCYTGIGKRNDNVMTKNLFFTITWGITLRTYK